MVSQYIYSQIMSTLEYNYDTREWHLSGRHFTDMEPDSTLIFGSKFAAHEFVYNYLGGLYELSNS